MRLKTISALAVAMTLATAFKSNDLPVTRFRMDHFTTIRVPEPSDIVVDPETGHFFIVSDNGLLFETDDKGVILRKAAATGWDYEGVEVKGGYVYVSDESARKVHRYNKVTLERDRMFSVPYHGARNSGFESIAWNDTKKCFVLISEKDPAIVFELNEDFQIINQYPFQAARDISSARWYDGYMYLLSDEDEAILKCDPNTYEVLAKFKIDILNPEGLAFDKAGKVIISADDLQRIYFFNTLPTARHD